MEIVQERARFLTDFEVISFISSLHDKKAVKLPTDARYEDLHTIDYELLKSLSSSPGRVQTAERITALDQALKPYQLTKAERLQMINLRPTAEVEIYLIIEEFETRFAPNSEQVAAKLIALVKQHLPKPHSVQTPSLIPLALQQATSRTTKAPSIVPDGKKDFSRKRSTSITSPKMSNVPLPKPKPDTRLPVPTRQESPMLVDEEHASDSDEDMDGFSDE